MSPHSYSIYVHGVAMDCRSIAQSQNQAPNIAGLYAIKLRAAKEAA